MATLKLFDAGAWVPIHTAVFDVFLPTLSPDAWKALCVAIRHAQGASNGHGAMSCAQFQNKMGCESQAAAHKALQECLEAGCLVQHENGAGQAEATYALNRDLQIGDDAQTASAETTPVQRRETSADDDLSPADRFLVAAWRFATDTEITAGEMDVLYKLLNRELALISLVNILFELRGRVDNVTVDLVKAVITDQMSIPPLEEEEEQVPPPPEQPHGPVMAAASETESDSVLALVVKMYENEIGLVTQGTAQQLMALTAEHRDLDKWQEAFDAVVRSNIRRLDYLVTCLENVGKPKSKRPGRRGGGRRQESTIKEKPPAKDVDAETLERQRAALAELRRKQRERE